MATLSVSIDITKAINEYAASNKIAPELVKMAKPNAIMTNAPAI